ncbi:pepsin-like aspartic protease [Rheinheimera baltica]|uniref:Pepsin-like aspartic protease n=3 Tax=Rheinheimera baltica TaxID=67576 RepID=A0ABT9HWN1_9GAMM|nr:pepsin-like aspartic protease [Rheinheimera baltica]MDP5135527.1 pepsin-like aspartic protease [Rheinheimera baltica]
MLPILRLKITNVYAKGDYTVTVHVGSEAVPLQLLLDTGSSTLALHSNNYNPYHDSDLTTTSLVQEVIYGIGGWAGAVAKTSVQLHGNINLNLSHNYFAVADAGNMPFAKADGILGLAYKKLNQATDISLYLQQQHPQLTSSLPWPFKYSGCSELSKIQSLLADYPKKDLTPWFSNITQQGLTADLFSFYCRRSSVHCNENGVLATQSDPLNQGWFILGGGPEQDDLYQAPFFDVKVLHDVYYNVLLTAVQVDEQPLISCSLGKGNDESNGFFDTGAAGILLPIDVYQKITDDISTFNPALVSVLSKIPAFNGVEQGISNQWVDTTQWPDLHFYFLGVNGESIKLTCPPCDYWQCNAPVYGLSSFKIIPQLKHFSSQHIIGLPLLCNYYTVFDRQSHNTGLIRCALACR